MGKISRKEQDLQVELSKLSKKYGSNIVTKLSSITPQKENITSTGIEQLDEVLGIGGIAKGSIVEISGPEMAGKTALALHIAKQIQKENPILYIDADHSLSPSMINGSGIEPDNFYILKNVDTLEDVMEVCRYAAPAFGAIIIDTVSALPTRTLRNTKIRNITGICDDCAQKLSMTIPILVNCLSKSGCTLIMLNQLREKLGVLFGSPELVLGGRAVKYYSSLRLDVRRTETLRRNWHGSKVIGQRIRIKVIKNTYGAPFRESEVDIIYGEGMR